MTCGFKMLKTDHQFFFFFFQQYRVKSVKICIKSTAAESTYKMSKTEPALRPGLGTKQACGLRKVNI